MHVHTCYETRSRSNRTVGNIPQIHFEIRDDWLINIIWILWILCYKKIVRNFEIIYDYHNFFIYNFIYTKLFNKDYNE